MRPFWKRSTPEIMAADGDVEGLMAALRPRESDFIAQSSGDHADLGWERRAEAARFLAAAPGEPVTAALLDALADVSVSVRLEALRGLAGRGDPVEQPGIASILTWPEEEARSAAAEVLGRHAEQDAAMAERLALAYLAADVAPSVTFSQGRVDALLWATRDAHRREIAEEAVRHAVTFEVRSDRARQVIAANGRATIPVLLAALDEPKTRLPAIRLLGDLRDSSTTQSLLILLDDPEMRVRAEAAEALGRIKDPRAVEGLLRTTADEEYAVREAALRALDGFGTPGIVWGVASAARGVLEDMVELGGEWAATLQGATPKLGSGTDAGASSPQDVLGTAEELTPPGEPEQRADSPEVPDPPEQPPAAVEDIVAPPVDPGPPLPSPTARSLRRRWLRQ